MSRDPLRMWGRFLEIAAAVVSVGAGIYLLSKGSGSLNLGGGSGESWFQVIAHGIGAYFIARGLWMFSQLGIQRSTSEAVERLVELNGGWDSEDEQPDSASG